MRVCSQNILTKITIIGEKTKIKMKENGFKIIKREIKEKRLKKKVRALGVEPLTLGSWNQPPSTWPSAL